MQTAFVVYSGGASSVDYRAKDLPAKQTEQDEFDHAAAGQVRCVLAAHTSEIDASPDQYANNPDNPKQ
jgi:hypothetical protein